MSNAHNQYDTQDAVCNDDNDNNNITSSTTTSTAVPPPVLITMKKTPAVKKMGSGGGGGVNGGGARLDDFLKEHIVMEKGKPYTNTNITGGKFNIPDDKYREFLRLYNKEIVSKNKIAHLTEKQKTVDEGGGPIVIDIDMRFPYETTTRIYTKEHVEYLVDIYLEELKCIYVLTKDTPFSVYVMEKPKVNRVADKKITKDGLHIIIGIQSDKIVNTLLRKRVLARLAELTDDEEYKTLPITNSWEQALDEGVANGSVGWQLYGSCKPEHDTYRLTHLFSVCVDPIDNELERMEMDISNFHLEENIQKLSVRWNEDNPRYYFKTDFGALYNKINNAGSSAPQQQQHQHNNNNQLMIGGGGGGGGIIMGGLSIAQIRNIKNDEELQTLIAFFLDNITIQDSLLKETYEYVMALPESYYGESSFQKWIRVGWCLYNISPHSLLIVFVAFSSQYKAFRFPVDVVDICNRWEYEFQNTSGGGGGATIGGAGGGGGFKIGSLKHWCKEEAPEKYKKIQEATIDGFMDAILDGPLTYSLHKSKIVSDRDLAKSLKMIAEYRGDKFVVVNLKSSGTWFHIAHKKHRWEENESGMSLRKLISTDLMKFFVQKSQKLMLQIASREQTQGGGGAGAGGGGNGDTDDAILKRLRMRCEKASLIVNEKLGNSSPKDNIMKEIKEEYWDAEFYKLIDRNEYLLCCENGVIDFKDKIFRNGRAEDYLTKSTKINYIKLDKTIHQPIMDAICDFFHKLFPEDDLYEYMWEHLSASLIGNIGVRQCIHYYTGQGQNGKSKLMELMRMVLGDYFMDFSVSFYTKDRMQRGAPDPELFNIIGRRFICSAEPSEGEILNEGPMKQLTGSDPMNARQLHGMPIEFIPQCSPVIMANNFLEIKATDHGTWRRIRVIPFKSLFTNNPDPNEPFHFPIDLSIGDQFTNWKEVFLAMLVERAFINQGKLNPCEVVMEASRTYQQQQDVIASFDIERIIKTGDKTGRVSKQELAHEFGSWFKENNGGNMVPKSKKIHDYMDKKYGKYNTIYKAWVGVKMVYNNNNENPEDVLEDDDTATN